MISRMRLDEIRRARGFSQEYMADKLGCHRNTYAKMEEKPQNITMEAADKIVNVKTDWHDCPREKQVIKTITIVEE